MTIFETLNGAKTPREWSALLRLFEDQTILTLGDKGWIEASRIVFDLRRQGLTLKNTIDAVIAQSAIEKELTILHDDSDFELIARVRELRLRRFSSGMRDD